MTTIDGRITRVGVKGEGKANPASASVDYNNRQFKLDDGAAVIAVITSCTNTSNPAARYNHAVEFM